MAKNLGQVRCEIRPDRITNCTQTSAQIYKNKTKTSCEITKIRDKNDTHEMEGIDRTIVINKENDK